MSTSLRSLFVIGFLFAGMTAGCAVEDGSASETQEENAARVEDEQADEASQVELADQKLAIQKKASLDRAARPESPKK